MSGPTGVPEEASPEIAGLDGRFTAAFGPLFTIAHRVAYRLTGDSAAAEDLAAETLSRVYSHWGRLAEAPYREAWVVRVTTNLTFNHLARKRPSPEREFSDGIEETAALRISLVEALRRLPSRQREAIVLRHLAGLSEVEVAAMLGVSHGTVKTHIRRGLTGLRHQLSERGGDHGYR